MSTLVENVAKVTAAHAALKEAIAAKGVAVPDGTKLSGMSALVGQIKTQPAMSGGPEFYAYSVKKSIDVPAVVFVDFAAATGLAGCFRSCSALTSLTLPAGFGQNATGLSYCFAGCSALTTITGNPNFNCSVSFSDSENLTHDSLMVVINGLQTVTTTQTLTLGPANLAKLTDEEKKIATDKGWTLA